MKTDNWFKCVSVVASFVLAGFLLSADARENSEFRHAIEKGAIAQLNVRIVDDEDNPVSGVRVEARFDSAFSAPGEVKTLITGTNGIASVFGRTGKGISLKATKIGYYGSTDAVCYISLGQGAKDGKWLPLDLEKKIVLRQIRNPAAERPHVPYAKHTKNTGVWIGFDVEKYDFVVPNGTGVYADMELKFDWDGLRGENFHGMGVEIRFTEPFSGAYYQDRVMTSDFKDAYFAVTNNPYQKKFVFYSRPVRNDKGEVIKREQCFFDSSKSLIVRSRCVVNANGTLKQARYSEISDFTFGCDSKGAWIMFQPIYNPTPNDTNLEPKR